MSQASQISVPEEEVSIWCDEKEIQNERRQALNDALGNLRSGRFSPILSTLNASWDDISSTQQKYYIRKAREAIAATLSVISPGQEKDLWKCIQNDSDIIERDKSSSSKRKHFDTNTGLIDVLIKAYDQAESWQTKRQILSLFANDFSRRELQTLIPGITKWRIDQACQHATEVGKGQVVPEQTIFRKRIDQGKVDHFISYISQPQLHQDVAFGTKTLKLDSGERIIIPAVVRTLIPSRINEQYTSYCREQQFELASTHCLFRMLEICSASMQRSLHGLDNITAEGTEAFDNLHAIINTLVENGAEGHWAETMRRDLKEAKRYLKTDYKMHVGRNENNSDHCTVHALSDPENPDFCEECPHSHDIHCDRCDSLDSNFCDILKKIYDLVIGDETRARINFSRIRSALEQSKPGKHIYCVLLTRKQNRTLLLSLTKKHALLSWIGR